MSILVVYGSNREGTAGLARMIADVFVADGHDAEVAPAADAGPVAGHEAVVVAGALYATRWHRAARRFVRRNAAALREVPVWLVSSGPLDDTAREGTIPPVPQVAAAMELVHARGHMTFGGRLAPDAKGFPASAMAKTRSGDWRDPEHVREWVTLVESELAA